MIEPCSKKSMAPRRAGLVAGHGKKCGEFPERVSYPKVMREFGITASYSNIYFLVCLVRYGYTFLIKDAVELISCLGMY